jgi:large subunit ribosomal protein L5
MLSLKEKYRKEVIPAMQKKFGYKSVMAVPRIEKIVINAGFGRLVAQKTSDEQKKLSASIRESLADIAGQMPVLTLAKKSISSFKLREGMPIGAAVALRGKKMYDFLDRVINVAIPRVRDFRGVDLKFFDKNGNLSMGFKEHTVFPEISPEKSKVNFGFQMTVVTSTKKREEGIELLRLMGFPLKKE